MANLSKMEKEFAQSREKAMQEVEEQISSLYQNGEETREFEFNSRSWSTKATDGGAEELWRYLKEQDLCGDTWQLTKEQAIRIAKMVENWNAPWEYQIARRYDVDQMEYYNAYSIGFGPVSVSAEV